MLEKERKYKNALLLNDTLARFILHTASEPANQPFFRSFILFIFESVSFLQMLQAGSSSSYLALHSFLMQEGLPSYLRRVGGLCGLARLGCSCIFQYLGFRCQSYSFSTPPAVCTFFIPARTVLHNC